jgi:peptide/nickel transport system substrate-binding protein
MKRRTLIKTGIQAGAAMMAAPSVLRAQRATTLRFVPYADLALLDPIVTTAYTTRTHGLMIFEQLYGVDDAGNPQPQMVAGHTVENDGRLWRLTLRDRLAFHDGTPVLARDVVASIKRWAMRDAFGEALMAATDALTAPSDKLVEFRLKRPFPALPAALGKPYSYLPVIMPERLASLPPTTQVTEMVGSGPYRFVANERVPGARAVYQKFDGYVPRDSGTPAFTSGPKIAHFDRIEWVTIPDAGTAAAALQAGEVDWYEQPDMDLVPLLRKNKDLVVRVVEDRGLTGCMRLNHLQPPFDNPAIRRVLMKAVRQRDFMSAVAGAESDAWRENVGMIAPSSPYANDGGMDALTGRTDDATLKRELIAAGYKGEKIVLLAGADVPRISAVCQVMADIGRRIGLEIDYVSTDWGTVVQRWNSKAPADKGGYHMFGVYFGALDCSNPAAHLLMRGNGQSAFAGWPSSPAYEALREKFLASASESEQKALAREMQIASMNDVTYLPLGMYYQPAAYRCDLTGILTGLPLFTNVRRG